MFDPVDPKQSFPALEHGILKYWKEEDMFERSIRSRSVTKGDPLEGSFGHTQQNFSFYDGPPFATGLPHYGHLLAGTIKDVIPRYQTMQGKRVERRFGWDCHGLPVEYEIEKEHGINSRKQIEEMGVGAFNKLCRNAVQRYAKEWRVTVERMGRWVDMDWDYRTMDATYMESIWWVFKSLFDKKLIYEGHKPMHICPRCQTPLSNFEVTQGYKDITDQTVTAAFKLESGEAVSGKRLAVSGEYILAWTTTPWTLPGNLFLAVSPKVKYVKVKCEEKIYIVAKERADDVFKGKEFSIEDEITGKSLIGKKYLPLFPYYVEKYGDKAFKVVDGKDFVTTTDGTGIVHIAPGFGEDDFNVGKKEGVPVLQHVGMDGKFTKEVTDFAGMDVKPKDDVSKADKEIAKWLKEHGLLFRMESYKHSYPHCWRCDSPLLNYATSSWFVAVESIKEKMLQVNADTQWVPGHIRDGRFGKWLEGARDWAISRNRYWGTPLPIWRCKETGELQVIGSRQEVMNQVPVRFTRVTVLRHGESEGNLIPIYQGKNPGTNLTANGKDQAASTGESLSTEKVTHIYYSPLARTKQTAEIIAKKTGAILIEDDRLREIEFGEYEGKTIDFSDLTFVKARRAHKLENNQVESIYHFPGMETWSHVQARMSAFLNEMLPKHRGDHVIVVTHADPLLSLKHFFTKEEPAKLCEQPYPRFAEPHTFYWDHDTNAEFDLHKETVDTISWPSSQHETSVDVTFVRHGETDWNKEKKIQGSNADNPLNDTGRKQAKECAQKLKGTSFDFIISSDLKRAVETAEILSKELGIPYTDKWSSLRERNLGDWSGQTRDSVHAAHPPLYPHSNVALHYLTPPNGESLSHYLKRAQQAHSEIIQKFPGKKILVVAHSGALQAFKILAGGESLEKASMMVPNGDAITMKLHPLVHRIPDVLDCWFESGSMPYAQSHYPFEKLSLTSEGDMTQKEAATGEQVESKKKKTNKLSTLSFQLSTINRQLPPGFPADFIAEGIDQTRGWFYTLTVLSAALFEKPAFMNCIVNGTVLAEDGKKMSKRLKNYPEPLEIVEKYGADAIRFALMSSPAVRGEDLRFSAKYVEEQLRNVLLPFWNTYSFFVTYANAAKWEPQENRRHSTHPLDVWIRTEIQDLVNRMTHQLENYELSATCSELADTIDALTNWYVRLSRRRFAGKSAMHEMTASDGIHEDERSDALHTLYDVLLTLSQLLAPFCPFMSEAMYLNLVSEDHGSVHLTDWPKTRELTNSERVMLIRTRMLRSVVSLGLQIRSEKKIKVRQPLHKATVAIPLSILPKNALNSQELSLLREELNVKNVEIIDDPGSIAEVYVHVNARVAGPRLGGRVQDIIRAGKEGNFAVNDDGTISIMEERLTSDEASLMYRGREGEDVAANKGVVISLDTRITPELSLEGDARDIIRAIQQLRKDEGYHMQDRIVLYIEGADDIIQMHGDLVLNETNAHFGKNDGKPRKIDLDKRHVTITFAKV